MELFNVNYPIKVREPLKLCNCTLTASLDGRISINDLPGKKMKKFDAKTVKAGGATFLVFGSGKIVCVGSISPSVAISAFEKLKTIIGREIKNTKVSNLVAHFAVEPVNLGKIYMSIKDEFFASYEPELFQALRITIKGVTVLIFYSGKIIITGAKDIKDIENTYKIIVNRLI